MAGAGYKLFNTGDVLTAAQVNTYLNEQTVMVFASSAARTSALSGVLAEGMVSYLQDTNAVEVYNGTSWTAVGGGGLSSPLTTKGDVWGYSTTNARIPVGSNGTVLTADSAETLGVKWAAPAGGGKTWTLLNAGGTNLTGAQTITVSGISNVEDLMIFINQGSSASAASEIGIRFNGDTGANYGHTGFSIEASSTYSASNFGFNVNFTNNQLYLAKLSSNAASQMCGGIWVSGCKSTGLKAILGQAGASAGGGNSQNTQGVIGFYSASAAITSVSAHSLTGNFDDGKLWVYGA